VLKVDNRGYLVVADGDLRKVERPKAKNLKHIRKTGLVLTDIRTMLLSGEQPENHVLRSSMRQLLGT
jgi:ribosomal protein L14E/L6E/L27E